jgi:tRNA modification GTPase
MAIVDLLRDKSFAVILNKIDLPTKLDEGSLISARPECAAAPHLFTSSEKRTGLTSVEDALLKQLGASTAILSGGVLLTNVRHIDALERAGGSLERARRAFDSNQPGELVMIDLRDAVNALGEIIGESIGEEILDRIFSSFCIGK